MSGEEKKQASASGEQPEVRREKRDKLRALGIDPYPATFAREKTCAEARGAVRDAEPYEKVVSAGRIRSIRDHGKSTFATIEDESGKMQVYFKKNDLGEKYELISLLDIGDFIGVRGFAFKTRMGEPTIHAEDVTVLAKAMEPLPSEWYGLSDKEVRYRRRYLDLIANPEVRQTFRNRARIVSEVRRFLTGRGFMEVETPMMQTMAGGAAARPFVTHHNTLDIDLYLRIAPELYLKRLIVGGFEKVFELNRNFRNEGMDRNHNPEFTMMEVYEAYSDCEGMMRLTESLVAHVANEVNGSLLLPAREGEAEIDLTPPWKRIPFIEAIASGGGPHLAPGDVDAAKAAVAAAGIETEENDYVSLLDALFERYAEPKLTGPVFITDYPTVMSPLAKKNASNPELVERFEAYLRGMEIANAFSELNDPDDQEARFRAQSDRIDEDYVSALRAGMPPCGGLGIGIDRLVMVLTGEHSIRDVILFPTLRP